MRKVYVCLNGNKASEKYTEANEYRFAVSLPIMSCHIEEHKN